MKRRRQIKIYKGYNDKEEKKIFFLRTYEESKKIMKEKKIDLK